MTEVINIPDRERAKDALILQLSEGRDKLAARVEALEEALRGVRAFVQDGLDTSFDKSLIGNMMAARDTIDAALKENQT